MTTLDEIKTFATGLSMWAHLATVGADGEPDVVPVHPAGRATCCDHVRHRLGEARNVAIS